MRRRAAATLFLICLICALPLRGGVEARTEHVRVVTELEPRFAKAAAIHLERARAFFVSLGLRPRRRAPGPLTVLLYRDAVEMESRLPIPEPRPRFARGFFQTGVDRDYIVLAWDATGNPLVALAHEQVHQLMAGTHHPTWFREGLAEYLSRWEVGDGGVHLGASVPSLLSLLDQNAWIPLAHLVTSSDRRDLVPRPVYYAQSWLIVHWLAGSAQGELPDPEELERRIDSMGAVGVEEQLRAHAQALSAESPAASLLAVSVAIPPAVELRLLEAWESDFYRADALREGGRREQARLRLMELERAFPARPEPSAAIGALEMDEGNYREAEAAFARAVTKGPVEPRTHYRYSLMLMRPEGDRSDEAERTRLALEHARRARQADAGELLYAFTEAQALVLAGRWSEAAERLADLASEPLWRERAEREFSVLLQRRQQALGAVPAPVIAPRVGPLLLPWLTGEVEPVPTPLPPPEPSTAEQNWPPPRTVVLYGHLTAVDCRGAEKIVTVETPRFRVRLRELADRRATLHSPPKKWRGLPCKARGYWEVNVAYRPDLKKGDTRGELAAILF